MDTRQGEQAEEYGLVCGAKLVRPTPPKFVIPEANADIELLARRPPQRPENRSADGRRIRERELGREFSSHVCPSENAGQSSRVQEPQKRGLRRA